MSPFPGFSWSTALRSRVGGHVESAHCDGKFVALLCRAGRCSVLAYSGGTAPYGVGDTVPSPRVTEEEPDTQGEKELKRAWNPSRPWSHIARCLQALWALCLPLLSFLHLENVPTGALTSGLPLGGGWVGKEDLFRVFVGGCM